MDSKPIFFCHIPKTGGHAVKKAAKLVLGEESVFSVSNLTELRNAQASGKLSAKKFIIGHLCVHEVFTVFRRSEIRLVTFIRDPAERLISQYYQIQSHRTPWLLNQAEPVLFKVKRQSFRDYLDSNDPNVQAIRSNVISRYFLENKKDLPTMKEPSALQFLSFNEGPPVLDSDQLLSFIDQFDFVVLIEDFDNLLRLFFSNCFPDRMAAFDPKSVGFVNTRYQKEDFDSEVFTSAPKPFEPIDVRLAEAIRSNLALDVRLYNLVAERAARPDLKSNGLPSCASALMLDSSPEFARKVARNLERRLQLAEQALAVTRSRLPTIKSHSRFAPEGYRKLLEGGWKIIRSERRQGMPFGKIILPRIRRRLGW